MIRKLVGSMAGVLALTGPAVLVGGPAAAFGPTVPSGPASVSGPAAASGVALGEDPPQYGSAPRPRPNELTLSYLAESGFAAAVKMTCDPAGGAHPAAAEVCATLDRVGADPAKIVPSGDACVLVYAPVTAEITGTWRGSPISWEHRYGNVCEMHRATGALFRF